MICGRSPAKPLPQPGQAALSSAVSQKYIIKVVMGFEPIGALDSDKSQAPNVK